MHEETSIKPKPRKSDGRTEINKHRVTAQYT